VGYCVAFRFITLLSSLNSDKLENFFKKKEEKNRKQENILHHPISYLKYTVFI
jgi:hypothetical protein